MKNMLKCFLKQLKILCRQLEVSGITSFLGFVPVNYHVINAVTNEVAL